MLTTKWWLACSERWADPLFWLLTRHWQMFFCNNCLHPRALLLYGPLATHGPRIRMRSGICHLVDPKFWIIFPFSSLRTWQVTFEFSSKQKDTWTFKSEYLGKPSSSSELSPSPKPLGPTEGKKQLLVYIYGPSFPYFPWFLP